MKTDSVSSDFLHKYMFYFHLSQQNNDAFSRFVCSRGFKTVWNLFTHESGLVLYYTLAFTCTYRNKTSLMVMSVYSAFSWPYLFLCFHMTQIYIPVTLKQSEHHQWCSPLNTSSALVWYRNILPQFFSMNLREQWLYFIISEQKWNTAVLL